MILLLSSALLKSPILGAVLKDMDKPERVQSRVIKMLRDLENLSFKERKGWKMWVI